MLLRNGFLNLWASKIIVPERSARSRKTAHGALEPEIADFDYNLIEKSMGSERPARSRKSTPGALEPEINDFD